jgi:leukotriene-A4 hydrolase
MQVTSTGNATGISPYISATIQTSQSCEAPTITEPSDAITSPVLAVSSMATHIEATAKGLKPWMLDFQKIMPPLPADPFSNAKPEQAVTTHLIWKVTAPDWDNCVLQAKATYSYTNKTGTDTLVLDGEGLNIKSIKVNGLAVSCALVKTQDYCPKALNIPIPMERKSGQVEIEYETSPKASGIYWVQSQHTEGKSHPLLYTLFESIEGASVIPGQHTPQVRLTWEVNVETGSRDMIALSSVKNNPQERDENGIYSGLKMDRACPLYLLSLVEMNGSYKGYGDGKTGVYAEDAMLNDIHEGLELLPKMMTAAEEVFGRYTWGTYNPVMLSWAFPYMAMEHPCASTCGRICVEQPHVIPHELAHSWTGNDTTNCNWQQFFWNEGWTVFGEFLICEKVWGSDYAAMVFQTTLQEALTAIKEYQNKPEVLQLCSSGTTFEFTRIPYAKGALFFFMLREAIGKEKFIQFVHDYMKVFYQNTMSDTRFLAFLKLWVQREHGVADPEAFLHAHKVNEWLYGTEIPENAPEITSNLLNSVKKMAENVVANSDTLDVTTISAWDVTTQLAFLSALSEKATKEQLNRLDDLLNYTESDKVSLRGEWAQLCAKTGYFTEKTMSLIVGYVIMRNSTHEANKIGAALSKTEMGKTIIYRILDEENGRLFPLTRQTIEKHLNK